MLTNPISAMKNILSLFKRKCRQFNEIHDNVQNVKFFMRRVLLEDKILHSTESGIRSERYCDRDIIVSLTTYGRRLEDVCFTIESLMQQTRKANRIILWLDTPSLARPLPETLVRQQARGLEIRATEDDIRSYKKLIPALEAFPDDVIITVDDDALYDFDFIERLVGAYLAERQAIHACRIHTMLSDSKGRLESYNRWKLCFADPNAPSRYFFTGVGGVLYPPRSLDSEVLNREVFTAICPTADDVWFNAMARKKGTPVRKVATRSTDGGDFLSNDEVQDMGLCNINTGRQCQNDPQIEAVFSKYGIYQLIK